MTKAKTYFTDAEPEDIEYLEVTSINVSDITSNGNLTSNAILTNSLGVGTSTPEYSIDIVGDINFTDNILKNGIPFVPEYSTTSGISTVAENLTGTPNIVVGITTVSAVILPGSTVTYTELNTSVIDSNNTSVHYITFNTTNTAVNISNFGPGKKVEVIIRSTAVVGARNIVIRTSTTATDHNVVPTIVNVDGTILNGIISIPANSGVKLSVFNINGTVVGSY